MEPQELTFLALLCWLVNYRAVLQASQVKHSYTAISTTADKYVDAVSAEAYIEDLLVMRYQLRFCSQCWNVPYCTGCVDTGSDDQTRRDRVPVQ